MYVRNVVLFVIVVAVVAVNAFIAFVVVDIARLYYLKRKRQAFVCMPCGTSRGFALASLALHIAFDRVVCAAVVVCLCSFKNTEKKPSSAMRLSIQQVLLPSVKDTLV